MRVLFSLFSMLWFMPVSAGDLLDGNRSIVLVSPGGEEIHVGHVEFAAAPAADAPNADPNRRSYKIVWDDTLFTDQFLSMRPFKCLKGVDKMWCRVPYPYKNNRLIEESDLIDLEYDLMFVWKNNKAYGIDMWNGVYYRLRADDDRIRGSMFELDLDQLSAPPEEGDLRPVRDADLSEAEPGSHWLPYLVIK